MRYCASKRELDSIPSRDDCFYIRIIYIKNEILKCPRSVHHFNFFTCLSPMTSQSSLRLGDFDPNIRAVCNRSNSGERIAS